MGDQSKTAIDLDWQPPRDPQRYADDPNVQFMAAYERYERGMATDEDMLLLDEILLMEWIRKG